MKIRFLGAAGTVTGSKTLLESASGKRGVLVDCGLYQGLKALRLKNREPFAETRRIDSVILTHAHLDHTGYLPLLVKAGFRGKIFCTAPTRDLMELVLLDAAHLQEEDAAFANREGFSKHRPAEPLFTTDDARRALSLVEVVREDKEFSPAHGFTAKLRRSGHILGSCWAVVEGEGRRALFSGDLGRPKSLLYPAAEAPESVDTLVIESTYGDRIHRNHHVEAEASLQDVVCSSVERGGHLIIPAFAIGRSQELLYLLSRLRAASRIPAVPVFLDTPMGSQATQIFMSYPAWHKLSESEIDGMERVAKIVRSQQESIAIMRDEAPKIIIAGSGMAAGGRVLHHLASKLPDPKHTVLLVGFQSAGSRGRLMQDGAPEVKIHGRFIPVRARIETISALSAHADQPEIIEWLKRSPAPPKRVFINHGEPQAADALRVKIRDTLGWNVTIPCEGEAFELD